MYELKEIRSLVNELVNRLDSKAGTDIVIEYLHKIGAELLKNCEIRIGSITIEPLRVEPYLFKEDTFEDKFIQQIIKDDKQKYYGPQQRNRFGKLYIHSGYTGVDIVLSDNDNYAFSFLIKNSRVLINNKEMCIRDRYDAVLHSEFSDDVQMKEGNIVSCVYRVQGWPKQNDNGDEQGACMKKGIFWCTDSDTEAPALIPVSVACDKNGDSKKLEMCIRDRARPSSAVWG